MRNERYAFDVPTVEIARSDDERYHTFSNDEVPTTVENEGGIQKICSRISFLQIAISCFCPRQNRFEAERRRSVKDKIP